MNGTLTLAGRREGGREGERERERGGRERERERERERDSTLQQICNRHERQHLGGKGVVLFYRKDI